MKIYKRHLFGTLMMIFLIILCLSTPSVFALNEIFKYDFDLGKEFPSLIDGVRGKAGWFDGKSYLKPLDGKVSVPKNFTFHIWVKPEAYIGGYQGIIGFVGRLLLNSNGILIYQVGTKTLKSRYRLDFYRWSLITVTYDTKSINLYVNSDKHGMANISLNSHEYRLSFGKAQYFYLGGIDEAILYEGVMGQSEINNYYESIKASTPEDGPKVQNITIRDIDTISGKVNFQKTFSVNMDRSDSSRPFLHKNKQNTLDLKKNADTYARKYKTGELKQKQIGRACLALAKFGVIAKNDAMVEMAISILMDRVSKGTGAAKKCHRDHYGGNFGFYKYLGAYDYLCKSPAFKSSQRLACKEYFLESIKKTSAHWASKSSTNHGFVESTAGTLVGICLKDTGLIGWGMSRLISHLQRDVLCDGSWYQNSMLVHNMVVGLVGLIIEPLKNSGIAIEDIIVPVSSKKTRDISNCMEKTFFLMKNPYIKLATPDRKIPCMGYYTHSKTYLDPVNYKNNLVNLIKPFDSSINADNLYEEMDSQQGKPAVLPDSGFAVLRAGKKKNKIWVLLSYGDHSDVVHHLDNFNIILWAYGRFISPDFPRVVRPSKPFYKNYIRQAWSHNCVVVDGKTHSTKRGVLEYMGAKYGVEIVNVIADETYDGVSWRRILALSDHYLICIDKLVSKAEHVYDFFFHLFDAKSQVMVTDVKFKDSSFSLPNYPFYYDVSSYEHGERFAFFIGDEICNVKLTVLNVKDAEIFIGNIPTKFNNEKPVEKVANLVVRKKSKEALFISFFDISKSDSTIFDVTFADDKCLTIKHKNGTYNVFKIFSKHIEKITSAS